MPVSIVLLLTVIVLLLVIVFILYRKNKWQNKIIIEVTEEKDRWIILAEVDELTKILSRRTFLETVGRMNKQLPVDKNDRRTSRTETLAILFFDLDHFKDVNDGFGHEMGDNVLREVAQAAQAVLRDGDIIGRLGGEEFGVALTGIADYRLREIAEAIRAKVAELTFASGKLRPKVSIGAATTDQQLERVADLIKMADDALYKAKRGGRNRVEFYEG